MYMSKSDMVLALENQVDACPTLCQWRVQEVQQVHDQTHAVVCMHRDLFQDRMSYHVHSPKLYCRAMK